MTRKKKTLTTSIALILMFCLSFVLVACGNDDLKYTQEEYDAAMTAEYTKGYDKGKEDSDAYDLGYDEGYEAGKAFGYLDGWEKGFAEGQTSDYDEGYDAGYEEGKNKGEQDGYAKGYADGLLEDSDYEDGFMDGYEAGHADGVTDGKVGMFSQEQVDAIKAGMYTQEQYKLLEDKIKELEAIIEDAKTLTIADIPSIIQSQDIQDAFDRVTIALDAVLRLTLWMNFESTYNTDLVIRASDSVVLIPPTDFAEVVISDIEALRAIGGDCELIDDVLLHNNPCECGEIYLAQHLITEVRDADWKFLSPQLKAQFIIAVARLETIESNLDLVIERAEIAIESNKTAEVTDLILNGVDVSVVDQAAVASVLDARTRVEDILDPKNATKFAKVHPVVKAQFMQAIGTLEGFESVVINTYIAEAATAIVAAQKVVDGGVWYTAFTDLTDPANPIPVNPTISSELQRFGDEIFVISGMIDDITDLLDLLTMTSTQKTNLNSSLDQLKAVLSDLEELEKQVQLNQDVIDAVALVKAAVAMLDSSSTIAEVSAAKELYLDAAELAAKLPASPNRFASANLEAISLPGQDALINAQVIRLLPSANAALADAVTAADTAITSSDVPASATIITLQTEILRLEAALAEAELAKTTNIIGDLTAIEEKIAELENLIDALIEKKEILEAEAATVGLIQEFIATVVTLSDLSTTKEIGEALAMSKAIDPLEISPQSINAVWLPLFDSHLATLNGLAAPHKASAQAELDAAVDLISKFKIETLDVEKTDDLDILEALHEFAENRLEVFGELATSSAALESLITQLVDMLCVCTDDVDCIYHAA